MISWARECHRVGQTITDKAIREMAKSLVPELVKNGTFKASTGWVNNFKTRNGIRRGRMCALGTTTKDERASGLSKEIEPLGRSGRARVQGFLEVEALASGHSLF